MTSLSPPPLPQQQSNPFAKNRPQSCRVHVTGLSKDCTKEILKEVFSKVGTVTDIECYPDPTETNGGVSKRYNTKKRNRMNPFAFISFETSEQAHLAVTQLSSYSYRNKLSDSATDPQHDLYTNVQFATPMNQNSKKYKSLIQEGKERDAVLCLSNKSNLLLQVQSSHLDRLTDHIVRIGNNSAETVKIKPKVHGSAKASNSKNMSLLFVSALDSVQLSKTLYTDPVLSRALKKSYLVQEGVIEGTIGNDEECDLLANVIVSRVSAVGSSKETFCEINKKDQTDHHIFRMKVFPPKLQSRLIQAMDRVLGINPNVTIDSVSYTHVLSIIEVYHGDRNSKKHGTDLFMIGVTPASIELNVTRPCATLEEEKKNVICRSYFKLKEAFERYTAEHCNATNLDSFHNSIAFDCGSSPGGWTKFLIQDLKCQTVYSVDPGLLSPSVLELNGVVHMQVRTQEAIPELLQRDLKGKVNLWVGDACLGMMKEQVELLLLAKARGLLAPVTFFVLTLKCVIGRSKDSFDGQVRKVVDHLCSKAVTNKVAIYHLFSNKNGERTVMGYIT